MRPEKGQTEVGSPVFTKQTAVFSSYIRNGVNSIRLCSFGRENIQRMTRKSSLMATKYKLLVYLANVFIQGIVTYYF